MRKTVKVTKLEVGNARWFSSVDDEKGKYELGNEVTIVVDDETTFRIREEEYGEMDLHLGDSVTYSLEKERKM